MSNLPKCPRCGKEDARMHPLFGIMLGQKCRAEDAKLRSTKQAPEFYVQSMQTRVQEQRDAHEKDFIPPYNFDGTPSEEFARAYPDKAKELFTDFERVTGQKTELAQ